MLAPLRLLFFLLAAPPLVVAFILYFSIDHTPKTQSNWKLTQNDIQRAKTIVSNTTSKTRKTIRLNEKDLNIALNYLLNYYIQSNSQIDFQKDLLQFRMSLLLNNNFFGKYLNLKFNLNKQQGYPSINSLKIGTIHIADEFAGLILESIIKYTPLKEYYILAAQHIRDIQISSNNLTISYIFSDENNLKDKLGPNSQDYLSVIFYQQQITQIIAEHDPMWRLSLAELLQPLFKSAYQRSTPETAILENRAVLLAVSTYVNKSEIQAYLPFDISPATDRQYSASLYKRTDMAKHFMISAALAAAGAETLAYMLGQEKELQDAKQGSGFSFIDLAGDRAGLHFGKIAVASTSSARQLQKRMSIIRDYTAFMPDVRDLPENMGNTAFKRQYNSVHSHKYQEMLKIIDGRISSLAIYQ